MYQNPERFTHAVLNFLTAPWCIQSLDRPQLRHDRRFKTRGRRRPVRSEGLIHRIYRCGGAVICRPAACHHMARINGASDAAAAARAMIP